MKRTVIGLLLVVLFCFRCGAATLDVTSFGAVGNCTIILVNVTSGSPTVTANSGTPFSSADVGKVVQIYGGGPKTTITSTGWGSSPTNNADIVAQISAFVNSTTVTLDRNCGATTNAATMTYGTNNIVAFSNCVAAATSGASTVHIPAGNYLLCNPSALSSSFTQSGAFDAGTPALSIFNGNILFWGDGTNSSILTGNGAWQIKGLQQAFRGQLIKIGSVTNNGSLVFSNLQFNGSATRNHSQAYTSFPAAPTDGSGWDVTHHAIVNNGDPTAPTRFGVTNCLFVHWHGETMEGTDAGNGVTDVGNTWFVDGNATAVNFNGVHSYHEYLCTDYYQFAEDGQFKNATGVNVIKNGTLTSIDHIGYAITGAQSNQPAPSFIVSNNVFGVTSNVRAIGTAGVHDLYVLSNYLTGPIELGISGNQGTFGNSNIVVGMNVFSNSPNVILLSGDTGLNKVYSVLVTNNSGSNITRWADATIGGWGTNTVFSNNIGDSTLHSIDTSGQFFVDDPSNRFPWVDDDTSQGTNFVSYGLGYRHRITTASSGKKFVLVSSNFNQIPIVAQMLVTNAGSAAITAYVASTMNYVPITIASGAAINFYWNGTTWESRSTNTAATCDWFNVQAVIDGSNPGDTVIVPPGTCDYIFRVQNTNAIYLVTASYLNTNLAITTIQDSITNASDQSASSCFNFAVPPLPYREAQFAGFKFVIGSRATRLFDSGTLHLSGRSQLVRVNNNTFSAKLNIGIGGGDVFGVIDHNIFDALGQFTAPMKLNHDTIFGGQNGDGAWALPPWTNNYVEDASAIYIEDNTFTNTSGAPGLGIDSQGGAKLVVRHNIFSRMIAGGHGTETTQRERGSRVKDVYNNLWADNFGDSECGHYRSGTGMVFSNEVHNSSGFFTIRAYRLDSNTSPWGEAIGTNAWDINSGSIFGSGTVTAGSGSGTMNDSTATWTPHQWQGFSVMNANTGLGSWVIDNTSSSLTYNISTFGTFAAFNTGNTYQFRRVITILDQPGRGRGMLMSNNPPVINGIVQPPLENLEPIYSWSNTFFSVSGGQTLNNGGYYPVVQGQELFNTNNPNFVAYQYPHPLVSASIPSIINLIITAPITISNIRTNGGYSSFIVNHGGTTNLSLFSYDRAGNSSDVRLSGTGITPLSSANGEIAFTTNGNLCFLATGNGVKTARLWEWSLSPSSGLPTNATLVTTFDLGMNNADTAFMVTMRNGSVVGGFSEHRAGNHVFPIYRFTNGTWTNYGTTDFGGLVSGLPSTFISACEQPIDNSLFVFQTQDGGNSINCASFDTSNGLTLKNFGICAIDFKTNTVSVDPKNEPYGEICTVQPFSDWNSNRIVIAFNNANSTATGFSIDKATQVSVTEVFTNNGPRTSFITNYFFGHNVLWYTTNLTNQIVREFSSVLPTLYGVNGAAGSNLLTLRWLSYNTNNQTGVGTKWPLIKQSNVANVEQTPALIDQVGAIFNVNQYFPYNGDITYQDTNSAWHLIIDPATQSPIPPPPQQAPTISQQPQSTTVYATQTALFSIVASGTSPLIYSWKTNGVAAGTNGSVLSVGPCPIGFSGMSVVCVVANSVGSATSSTATLTVLPDPAISVQPANATVGVGATASFSVTASGQSPLTYQWSKNGSSIGGATASSYTTPATVAGDNNSQFFVVVTDTAGSLQSATATLTVTNIPAGPDPIITAQPQSTNIFNNQGSSFNITATGGSTLHYQWKTNAVNAGTDSATLTLPPAPLVWNGMSVLCIVSDLAGSVTSSVATLTVLQDPVITQQPMSVVTPDARTASFSVTATGQTSLSYQWSRNGSSVAGATQSAYTTPLLYLTNNGDFYFVDVTDTLGTIRSANATLTVIPGPSRIAKVNILRVGITKTGP